MERSPPSSRLSHIAARRRIQRQPGTNDVQDALKWAEDHRGRPAIKPPPRVGVAAARLIKPLAKRFGPGVNELDEHWEAIVGAPLAQWSKPDKIVGTPSGLTLVVQAKGPAAALIEAQSNRILERVGQYAGRQPKRLKLIQFQSHRPVKLKPSRSTRSMISDNSVLPSDPRKRLSILLERGRSNLKPDG